METRSHWHIDPVGSPEQRLGIGGSFRHHRQEGQRPVFGKRGKFNPIEARQRVGEEVSHLEDLCYVAEDVPDE